jgi:hypothetical protein
MWIVTRESARAIVVTYRAIRRRNYSESRATLQVVGTVRRCRVSVRGQDGVTHAVVAEGNSLFEVAAAAIALLHDEGWAGALPPDAVVQVEVQLPAIVHEVPLKALERWAAGPSVSPREELLKRRLRSPHR